jgi:hypothetical protein
VFINSHDKRKCENYGMVFRMNSWSWILNEINMHKLRKMIFNANWSHMDKIMGFTNIHITHHYLKFGKISTNFSIITYS